MQRLPMLILAVFLALMTPIAATTFTSSAGASPPAMAIISGTFEGITLGTTVYNLATIDNVSLTDNVMAPQGAKNRVQINDATLANMRTTYGQAATDANGIGKTHQVNGVERVVEDQATTATGAVNIASVYGNEKFSGAVTPGFKSKGATGDMKVGVRNANVLGVLKIRPATGVYNPTEIQANTRDTGDQIMMLTANNVTIIQINTAGNIADLIPDTVNYSKASDISATVRTNSLRVTVAGTFYEVSSADGARVSGGECATIAKVESKAPANFAAGIYFAGTLLATMHGQGAAHAKPLATGDEGIRGVDKYDAYGAVASLKGNTSPASDAGALNTLTINMNTVGNTANLIMTGPAPIDA